MGAEQTSFQWESERRLYSVSELNAAVHALLDREFQDIWVAGEISGVKLAASGHYYFTLKDQSSQLRCVCFRTAARYLRFKPQDGIAVLARGRVDVYEARGEYQLLVEALEPRGFGALQLAFEQLKARLAEEGLFDASRKRPLPRFPGRIGIVTSRKGAVIRDILQILDRRFPGLHIRLYPVTVQGEGSVAEVVEGIDWFSESGWPDVVIVARGGGSIEDLWTFNEEAVARAIARCPRPVISAIGHETDVTIADFVADLRAPTPSAAAELVIPAKRQLLDGLAETGRRLERTIRLELAQSARRLHEQGTGRATSVLQRNIGRSLQRVDEFDFRLRERAKDGIKARLRRFQNLDERLRKLDLRLRFANARHRMELAEAAAGQRISLRLTRDRGRLDSLARQVSQLNPLAILNRGYAIVLNEEGGVIKDAANVSVNDGLDVRLSKGRLAARVTRATPVGSSELPS